jgi:hypothetical protein
MLFLLQSKNTGVKFFESMVLLVNARYSHGPSLKKQSVFDRNSSVVIILIPTSIPTQNFKPKVIVCDRFYCFSVRTVEAQISYLMNLLFVSSFDGTFSKWKYLYWVDFPSSICCKKNWLKKWILDGEKLYCKKR